MKVVILFGPDPECVDPLDTHQQPRRHHEEIEGDVVVLWRTQTDPDEADGHDDIHVAGQGIFEHITTKQARKFAKKAGLL